MGQEPTTVGVQPSACTWWSGVSVLLDRGCGPRLQLTGVTMQLQQVTPQGPTLTKATTLDHLIPF